MAAAKSGLTISTFGQAFTPFFVDGGPAAVVVVEDQPTGGGKRRRRTMAELARLAAERNEQEVEEWLLKIL